MDDGDHDDDRDHDDGDDHVHDGDRGHDLHEFKLNLKIRSIQQKQQKLLIYSFFIY